MPAISWTGVSDLEAAARIAGPRLRQLRVNRGLSIRELAHRAKVSKNTVLRIEQGEPITEEKLTMLCNKLQTILPNLLLPVDEAAETASVRVHRNDPAKWHVAFRREKAPKRIRDFDQVTDPAERKRLGQVGFVSGFVHSHDAALAKGRLQAATVELYGLQENPGFRHSGEEYVYCLDGSLKLTVGTEEFLLEPGDAAIFDSSLRHRYESLLPLDAQPPTRILMVWYEGNEDATAVIRDEECDDHD